MRAEPPDPAGSGMAPPEADNRHDDQEDQDYF